MPDNTITRSECVRCGRRHYVTTTDCGVTPIEYVQRTYVAVDAIEAWLRDKAEENQHLDKLYTADELFTALADVLAQRGAAAIATTGKELCPCCGAASVSPPAEVYCVKCATGCCERCEPTGKRGAA
jgi:hypothetical protein